MQSLEEEIADLRQREARWIQLVEERKDKPDSDAVLKLAELEDEVGADSVAILEGSAINVARIPLPRSLSL